MKLPISLGWRPTSPIRVDRLTPLRGECSLHVHLSEGEDKGHLKLEYGSTPYCLSLFIFDLKAFMEGRAVRVRSYDLWDRGIMYAAKMPDGRPHPKCPGWFYREDAVIIDWGTYSLVDAVLEVQFIVSQRRLRYMVVFDGIRRYHSPKYGYSVRSEYILKPLGA